MDTKLLELSDRLKELRDKKAEMEAEEKGVNEQIDEVSNAMIEIMTNDELTSFNRNGMNFSMVVQEYPAPVPELKDELYAVMKEQGFEHLFSINSRTLQATVKELISNNDGVLPAWLEGLIQVAEKQSIRLAKSKKY